MRYRLRTLLIVLAILPQLLWFGWMNYAAWRAEQARLKAAEAERPQVLEFYIGITR
jgi:predicted negative regulator of RcsB-dependent stress response